MAKPRPMNSVSKNLVSAKKDPPQDLSDPNSPGNQELDQSCVSSHDKKLTRNINPNRTVYFLGKQQNDTQSSSTRKLGRRAESSNSARARQLERSVDIQFGWSKLHFHNMQISDHRYLEKVFKNPIIGIEALNTNVLICGLFMSTTMKAAIHLGPNYVEHLDVYRNTNFEELQNLFDITQKLILNHQSEILNVTTIDWTSPSWARSTLTYDQVITWTKAKVRVFSDSVL